MRTRGLIPGSVPASTLNPRLRALAANSLASCSVAHSFRSHSTSLCAPTPLVRMVDTNQEFIESILANTDAGLIPKKGKSAVAIATASSEPSHEKIN
jgi:hypothetical protein